MWLERNTETDELIIRMVGLLLVLVRCHIIILIRMRRRGKVGGSHQGIHNPGPWHPRYTRWSRWQRRRLLLKLKTLNGWIMHHCCRHLRLRWLLESVVVPAPFLLELFVEEANTPARLFPNLLEDLQDFLLLSSGNQTMRSDSK